MSIMRKTQYVDRAKTIVNQIWSYSIWGGFALVFCYSALCVLGVIDRG